METYYVNFFHHKRVLQIAFAGYRARGLSFHK